jgi:hypothetical protein
VLLHHDAAPEFAAALRLGKAALAGGQDAALLRALGFGVERLDAVTSVFSGSRPGL